MCWISRSSNHYVEIFLEICSVMRCFLRYRYKQKAELLWNWSVEETLGLKLDWPTEVNRTLTTDSCRESVKMNLLKECNKSTITYNLHLYKQMLRVASRPSLIYCWHCTAIRSRCSEIFLTYCYITNIYKTKWFKICFLQFLKTMNMVAV